MTMNRKITCVDHLYSTLERIVLYTKTNCLCCCLVMGLRIEQAAAYSSGTEAPHTAQLPAVAPPTRANFITRSVYIMPHSLSKYPSFLSLSSFRYVIRKSVDKSLRHSFWHSPCVTITAIYTAHTSQRMCRGNKIAPRANRISIDDLYKSRSRRARSFMHCQVIRAKECSARNINLAVNSA
jgi:hypothetical protein